VKITFDLPHVFYPGASPVGNAMALRALLNCLIEINSAYLRDHTVKSLYNSGVVYGRTQIWDTIPALYQRGYGDCKSLTAALVAERRKQGLQAVPVFRFKQRTDGNTDFHILVRTPSGFEDPSKVMGMGKDENAWFKR
jgi:hypothetical protein